MNTLLLINSGKSHSYFTLLTTLSGGNAEAPGRETEGAVYLRKGLVVLLGPELRQVQGVSDQAVKGFPVLLPTLLRQM